MLIQIIPKTIKIGEVWYWTNNENKNNNSLTGNIFTPINYELEKVLTRLNEEPTTTLMTKPFTDLFHTPPTLDQNVTQLIKLSLV